MKDPEYLSIGGISAAVLLFVALILVTAGRDFLGYPVLSEGDFAAGFLAAGNFSVGIFAAGTFAVGVFAIGIFSVGIFSVGIFNIGLFSVGIYTLGLYTKRMTIAPEEADRARQNAGVTT